jgi:hypothetical protein
MIQDMAGEPRREDIMGDDRSASAPARTRYAVVPFIRRGPRMVAEDIHYLDTYEQAQVVARFIAARRPGVLVLSVAPMPGDDEPEIAVLERIGSGLSGAGAWLH